jgi:electron transfer flavoprotein beta subunit
MDEEEKEAAPAPVAPRDNAGALVVACLAPADLRPDVNPLTGVVRIDVRRADLSAPDAAALELALQVAEAWGGHTLAVVAGPPGIDGVLRQALAVGADVKRVSYGPDHSSEAETVDGPHLVADPAELAAALAGAIRVEGSPALVVCGDRSALRGTGAVPAFLAHHLGAAQALGLVSLRMAAAGGELIGERRLDGGWRERLRIRPPAVCSVEAAGVRLRRASLTATLAAANTAIPVWHAIAVSGLPRVSAGPARAYRPRPRVVPAPAGSTRDRLLALTGAFAAHDPPRIVGPVDADGGVEELLEYLTRHGFGESR